MIQFIFTKVAEKSLQKFQKPVQDRILMKLKALKLHDDIFSILKRLYHFAPATHRLRIGAYRLILALVKQTPTEMTFFVLDIGDRKDVYR